jgi:hypothetical protein
MELTHSIEHRVRFKSKSTKRTRVLCRMRIAGGCKTGLMTNMEMRKAAARVERINNFNKITRAREKKTEIHRMTEATTWSRTYLTIAMATTMRRKVRWTSLAQALSQTMKTMGRATSCPMRRTECRIE